MFEATVCNYLIHRGSYSLWYNNLCYLMYLMRYFLTSSDQLLFTTNSYYGFPVWLESTGGHDVYWNLAGILFGGSLCSNPQVSVYSVHSKNFKVTALLFAIQLLIQVCFLMQICWYNPYSENYAVRIIHFHLVVMCHLPTVVYKSIFQWYDFQWYDYDRFYVGPFSCDSLYRA